MDDPIDVNVLFERYFARWYPEPWVQVNRRPMIRPDIANRQEAIGRPVKELSRLPGKLQDQVRDQIAIALQAAEACWQEFLTVSKPVDERWVDAFDRHFTRDQLGELLSQSSPEKFDNPYLVLCCQFGAVLGHLLEQYREPR